MLTRLVPEDGSRPSFHCKKPFKGLFRAAKSNIQENFYQLGDGLSSDPWDFVGTGILLVN
jgi:hypothetical protein